jgi:uncharacterized membrane protein
MSMFPFGLVGVHFCQQAFHQLLHLHFLLSNGTVTMRCTLKSNVACISP